MKQNSLQHTVGELVEYIEGHARSRLTLDQLASAAGLSKFHLHRMFRKLTRRGIMEYVRSRQLAQSLADLVNTRLRVEDIAQEYGFEHCQSYIRSFKNEFGITPAKFREGHTPVRIVEKLDLNSACVSPDGKSMMVRPKIIALPAFHLVGVKHVVGIEDNMVNQTANALEKCFFTTKGIKSGTRCSQTSISD